MEPNQTPAPFLSGNPMRQRLIQGISIGGVTVIAAVLGGWFWVCLIALGMFQCFQELTYLMKAKKLLPSRVIVYLAGIALILLAAHGMSQYFNPVLTLGVMAGFIRLLFRHPRASIADVGATHLALLYTAYLPVYFILLRQLGTSTDMFSSPLPGWQQPGFGYLMFILLVISASDVGAYYIGKFFGKNLLYPLISPKKTKEGALGGIFFGLLAGLIWSFVIHISWVHAVILGLLLILIGQFGDLAESMLKRDAGVKDSGEMLRSHGGVLDRTDSYIFAGPVGYYYIYWVILKQGLAQDLFHQLHLNFRHAL